MNGSRLPQIRIGAIIAIAAVIAFGAWLALRHSGSSSTATSTTATTTAATTTVATGAKTASEADLLSAATSLGHQIYWAGAQAGIHYELTTTSDGRVYVRYLPKGVDAGSPAPYLTIATYPVTNAVAATEKIAKRPTSIKLAVGAGAVAFYNASKPTNVYEAFPGANYQIEVYAPNAGDAQQLVSSGKIAALGTPPVVTTTPATTTAAQPTGVGPIETSLSQLQTISKAVKHPVYWAGNYTGEKFELTQTSDGRIYVRYLPDSIAIGSTQPYFTVATYPLKNAYATTTAAASHPGDVSIPVKGGVAFYAKTRPTSVYIAFKGVDAQIEVFDTDPSRLHGRVASGKIQPVS